MKKLTLRDTDELKSRVHELKNIFDNSGLGATILRGNEILTLCNLFTNPAFANVSDVSLKSDVVTIVKIKMEDENEEAD